MGGGCYIAATPVEEPVRWLRIDERRSDAMVMLGEV